MNDTHSKLILFNKPFRVMCQFTDKTGRKTLSDYIDIPGVYPAGLLDYDSEGLVVLTDNGKLQAHITQPQSKTEKTYWVQVEGVPSEKALQQLRDGIFLRDKKNKTGKKTLPAQVCQLHEPKVWARYPPIRFRRHISTTWLEIKITEGRNRQIRRMTAAVGYPTLRLIRVQIGKWNLSGLQSGNWKTVVLT